MRDHSQMASIEFESDRASSLAFKDAATPGFGHSNVIFIYLYIYFLHLIPVLSIVRAASTEIDRFVYK